MKTQNDKRTFVVEADNYDDRGNSENLQNAEENKIHREKRAAASPTVLSANLSHAVGNILVFYLHSFDLFWRH